MINRTIGLRITRLRLARGLTTSQLAERAGLSQAQISRLENGKQGFRTKTLARIAAALSVTPSYLIRQDGENHMELPSSLAKAFERADFLAFAERLACAFLDRPDILDRVAGALEVRPARPKRR